MRLDIYSVDTRIISLTAVMIVGSCSSLLVTGACIESGSAKVPNATKCLSTITASHQTMFYTLHVHMIVHVKDAESVASMVQLSSATFARHWNRRKKHEGSVWEHPYKSTIIQDGRHLLNCMRYVSLNMVRAGSVENPADWRWCGHDELTGARSRYTVLDIEQMLQSLDMTSLDAFRRTYLTGIAELIERRQFSREAAWTESLAVGDRTFVEQVARNTKGRSQFQYGTMAADGDVWSVREYAPTYDAVSRAKSGCKAPE